MLCNGEPVNEYLKILELLNGPADGVIASFDQALFKVGVMIGEMDWSQWVQMEVLCTQVFCMLSRT